jgi:hypothetical protein
MVQQSSSPLAKDKLKKAVQAFSELVDQFPQKSRRELLHEIQLKFDLSPVECDFLNKYFSSNP